MSQQGTVMPRGAIEKPNAIKYIRDLSKGVNLSTSRESIDDAEAWWMEGLLPVAPGNLLVMPGQSSASSGVSGESGLPTYQYTFNYSGAPYVFLVWKNSGNGWIGPAAGTLSKYFTGTFTSGKTAACQWGNSGLLIVDSTAGYFDWSVTSAGLVTALSQSLQSVTITDGGTGFTSAPSVAFGGPGSGAAATAYIGIASVAVSVGGTGYSVGDILTLAFASGTQSAMTIQVTSLTGTAINGISVLTKGAGSTASVNPITPTGGSGTGAGINVVYAVTQVTVTARGSGYSSAPSVTFSGGGAPGRNAAGTAIVSGTLNGTAIAAYAGRAWIANGRTVTFTDAGSYSTFIGSGSQFTITDQYLANNITALAVANNYLYIFGDTSIDVLSNVTVLSNGTASFSRVNVSASIGTNQQSSIFSYYRGLAFANNNGFYILSGASPDRISDRLELLIPQIDMVNYPVYGAQVTIGNILCAAFMVYFTDSFTGSATSSTLICIYFKGRWTFYRPILNSFPFSYLTMGTMGSGFVSGSGSVLYSFAASGNLTYNLFGSQANDNVVLLTKLYDMGEPLTTKQVLNFAIGTNCSNSSATNQWAYSVDSESSLGAVSYVANLASGYSAGYVPVSSADNAKYVGMRIGAGNPLGPNYLKRLEWMAMMYKETNAWQ